MADLTQMASLPMDQLICSPIVATAKAQSELVGVTLDFLERVCSLSGDGDTSVLQNGVLSFPLERFDQDSGKMVTQKVSAPILSLVQIPNFAMESIDVSFDMEVKTSSQDTSSVDATVSAEVSGGFWGQNYKVSGSVSSKSESTRTSDSSAKYTINAKAKQMEQSEGMSKLCQIMASTIEPLPSSTN